MTSTDAAFAASAATLAAHQSGQAEAERPVRFVSVVLPCLNEEDAVGETVAEARRGLERAGVEGEVLVVDNGSTDRSVEVAQAAGAIVIREETRGYGAAHRAGVAAARGDVVVMADADQTYDLEGLASLLAPLRDGADMVVASRLKGVVAEGAMPLLHRRVGTPVITRLLRLLTGTPLSDSQSGYRAFRREQALALDLRAPGMEYASEMLLKAARSSLDIREVPSDYRARVGESKLRTLPDGWRHLRMLLVLSPHLALILPGLAAIALGLTLSVIAAFAPRGLGIAGSQWLPIFVGPALLIIGAQGAFLGAIAAHRSELTPAPIRRRLAIFGRPDAVDALLRLSVLIVLGGAGLDVVLLAVWLGGLAGPSLLGLAGIAQATIVIGVGGIVSVLSAEFARESIWR